MHPAFALTRTRLTETRSEFDAFLQANRERLVPLEENQEASAAWLRAVSRASGIEGKNLELLKKAFSLFETQIVTFIETWENRPTDEDDPRSSHKS